MEKFSIFWTKEQLIIQRDEYMYDEKNIDIEKEIVKYQIEYVFL